ncbi:MAG: CvpA family protein [Rhodospirillaceae bacterium]
MTVVDVGALTTIVVIALMAYLHGLVTEILVILCWGLSALASARAFPYVQPVLRAHIESQIFADGAALGCVFIVTLAVLLSAIGPISRSVRESGLGRLDRTLGLGLGVFRGLLAVTLAWMVATNLMPPGRQREWLREAMLRPVVEYGAASVRALLPGHPAGGRSDDGGDFFGMLFPRSR